MKTSSLSLCWLRLVHARPIGRHLLLSPRSKSIDQAGPGSIEIMLLEFGINVLCKIQEETPGVLGYSSIVRLVGEVLLPEGQLMRREAAAIALKGRRMRKQEVPEC